MASIDELKILITGDTTGIESSVKKALSIVQGGVGAMNDQTVDWTSIFSRSVSPAIISGVASVFAFAISQSVNFQTAMAQTGTAAGESSSQIAQMSQSALNLSRQVPSSAQDIGSAMAQVSAIFSDTADQQAVVAAMAELSASGFGSLSDIVSASTNIFKQFGVTTSAQAVQVLTDLMHSAEAAKESIPELASQFGSFSSQLPGIDKSVGTFNGLISTFGAEVQNLGASGASQIFSALGTAANGSNPALDHLGGGLSSITKSILTDGGLSAIKAFSTELQAMGPNAALIATNMGLSAEQVGQFQVNASKLPQVVKDAQDIASNTQSIGDAFAQSDNAGRHFQELWNTIVADVNSAGWTVLEKGFADTVKTMIDDAGGLFNAITDGLSNVIVDVNSGKLKSAFSDAFKGVGGVIQAAIVTPVAQVGAVIANAVGTVSPGSLNSNLSATGVGFSESSLSRIDKTASESGLMGSLISALQTGVKQGQYTTLVNTFHLNVPSGSGLTSQDIAKQLYNQFQGAQ